MAEFKAAMDLMRRLPPKQIETSLSNTLALVPDLVDDLLSAVDQPLHVMKCPESSKEFVLCDYNRDGDSYRSPWTNKYWPALDDGVLPPDHLRKMEITANEAFNRYRELYYEGGVSSCYVWECEGGFACCVAIHKTAPPATLPLPEGHDPRRTTTSSGGWNAMHVVEGKVVEGKELCRYKLSSTVTLSLASQAKGMASTSELSGSLSRALEREKPFSPADLTTHVSNMGEMVEEMEGRLRDAVYEVYFGKTRQVVGGMRTAEDERKTAQQSLMAEMMQR
eukprot:CAMPEP_0181315388 /NCGR_PEP_ID=MMETSP1101-20121128/15349_1 /TAXON_ID=46948 /ORGANISM="Rhodomonas abbreviata, Strain Caron Lab Isolate" /LENGTH=278 /DNA_ID=CAMNT_0023422593 /DNA_START=92 /DNA_END=924 /DNA_ORIENTATION=-